jgi:hypothetical protein
MPALYKIEPDGSFVVEDRPRQPSYDEIKKHLGCLCAERVTVLYDGKAAQMFVDEDGLSLELPYNHRASRIYANNLLSQNGRATYDDLSKEPPRGIVLWGDTPLRIVGRAILWTGRFR